MSRGLPLGLILGLINQVGLDGLLVDVGQAPDQSLVVDLKMAEAAIRSGVADGILVDEVHVNVSGISTEDLKNPGPSLLKRAVISVRHFAVRISRDWMNGVIERGPLLEGTPVDEISLVFNDKNRNQLIFRGKAKGLPFEATFLIGIRNNHVTITLDDVRVLGFLPVPGWLRNMVVNILNVEKRINRPGVSFEEQTLDLDVLRLLPIPLKMRFQRFETSGRYILVEGGDA